jgi:hypothetical protein
VSAVVVSRRFSKTQLVRLQAGKWRSFGSIPGRDEKFVSTSQRPDRLWFAPSLLSNADVKTAWSYTFTPPYINMAFSLVKHKENFTFYPEIKFHENPFNRSLGRSNKRRN